MTTPPREPFDAIAAWVERNSQRARQDAVQLTLRTGIVPDGSLRKKAVIELERGDRVDRVGLVEAWSSGEMDFILEDLSIDNMGRFKHWECATFEDFEAALDACYAEFQEQ